MTDARQATAPVSLTVRPRSPGLSPFVSFLGYYEGALPAGRERIMPSAAIDLMVNLHDDELRTYAGPENDAAVSRSPGAAISGPSSRYTVIDTAEQRRIISVGFALGGAWRFSGVPADTLTDQLVPLNELWGRDGEVLREHLLQLSTPLEMLHAVEDVLLRHVVRDPTEDRALLFAASALDRGVPVAAVTDRLGCLPSTLVRRFRNRIGLTPKRFSRIRRFQRVLTAAARADDIDWTDVALIHGFYDQAHLINEFRSLAGISPTAYRPRNPGERNHVPV